MKTILVIDDDARICDLVSEFLAEEGYEVLRAVNGLDGVALAHQSLPALIICDVSLPEFDGFQVLTELQKVAATRSIPFMFLTGNDGRAFLRRGMELGADDFLTKPFTPDELLIAVRTRLAKRQFIERQSQETLNDLRQSIARALPHELRTPLTAVYGYADLLLQDSDRLAPDHVMMVQSLNQGVGRLHQLSERFLLYADLELLALEISPLARRSLNDPGKVIRIIAQEVAARNDRQIDLILEVHDVPVPLEEQHLAVLIRELADNAFKFSDENTPVEISADAVSGSYVISVTDQGRGMTPQQIASIGALRQFDREIYEQQGAGLGLALAERLVASCGGKLTITSQPGQYTTISIKIPCTVNE